MPDHPADLSDLPAIRQLRRNLLVAFEVDERRLLAGGSLHSKPAERHLSLRDRLPRRSLVLLGGALSVFGAAGIAVAAVLGGGQAVTPNEWVAGKRAREEQVISAEQASQLGILRRPRSSTDAVPQSVVQKLSPTTFVGANGANFDLSRRVHGLPEGAAWVVPGAGHVCVIGISKTAAGGEISHPASGGESCAPNAGIAEGAVMSYGGSSRGVESVFVVGLVPDGVSTVTATAADGRTTSIPVYENVYIANLHGGTSLAFAGSSGLVNLGHVRSVTELDGRDRASADTSRSHRKCSVQTQRCTR